MKLLFSSLLDKNQKPTSIALRLWGSFGAKFPVRLTCTSPDCGSGAAQTLHHHVGFVINNTQCNNVHTTVMETEYRLTDESRLRSLPDAVLHIWVATTGYSTPPAAFRGSQTSLPSFLRPPRHHQDIFLCSLDYSLSATIFLQSLGDGCEVVKIPADEQRFVIDSDLQPSLAPATVFTTFKVTSIPFPCSL